MEKMMRNLICGLALFATSFAAMATDQSSSVCLDPLQRICKDTEAQQNEREVYVKNLKAEIAQEAKMNAAPRIAEMKNKISSVHFFKRMVQSYKIRNQEIMKSARKRIGTIESVVTNNENIKKIKNYMGRAIESTEFNETTKNNFKNVIESVVVGNFNDFIERAGLEDSAMAQLLNSACGKDGLVENAFATTLKNDRYVLICPGFLITMSQTATDSDRFNSILHAISHEMGHHIDNSKAGNELYAPYLNCMSSNYAKQFIRNKEDEKFCNKKDKTATECDMQVTLSHSGELVADAWGIRVLNLHMRDQQYSSTETDQLLTDSWVKLCGSKDEGTHPTGDFRIGTLLRTNPDIIEYLGCANAETDGKAACTL